MAYSITARQRRGLRTVDGAGMFSGRALMLFGAGLLGGIVQALVGGASFFTFPALMAAGLSSISANASNTVALMPGSFVAAYADRKFRPSFNRLTAYLACASIIGAAIGALLLVFTPEIAFRRLVPFLIGASGLLFYNAERLRSWTVVSEKLRAHRPVSFVALLLILVISIYGGYFGAGLGILLMAALAAIVGGEFRFINALKNMLGGLVSIVALLLFMNRGLISWGPAVVVMGGGCVGGFIGASIARVAPARLMRAVVIAASVALTAWYFWQGWIAG